VIGWPATLEEAFPRGTSGVIRSFVSLVNVLVARISPLSGADAMSGVLSDRRPGEISRHV